VFGERFLSSPELFPVRLSGERWGDVSACLDLPGGPYLIDGLTTTQRDGLLERFPVTPNSAATVELTVFRAPSSDFREIDTRGWSYQLEFEHDGNGSRIAGMNLMSRFATELSGAALWTPASDAAIFAAVLENVLRPLVARRLLAGEGLLIHSAAIVLGGLGYLFAGESGAGKSTIAQLALRAGHPVLSDDLNALVRDGEAFRLVPLPFTGDLMPGEISRHGARLTSVARLEKGDVEQFRPMAVGECVALLARCAPYVNRDALLTEQLLGRAAEVARSVTTGVLTFRREGSDVWPIISSPRW
jgi:hypothetical protein